jgi:hypothetical protein
VSESIVYDGKKDPEEYKADYKTGLKRLRGEFQSIQKQAERARLGGFPMKYRELLEKVEEKKKELSLYEDQYTESIRVARVSEYNNREEIFAKLEKEIETQDAEAVRALEVLHSSVEKRLYLTRKKVMLQNRISSTAIKYGLPQIAEARFELPWGTQLKDDSEVVSRAVNAYAYHYSLVRRARGQNVTIDEFLSRASRQL